MAYDPWGKRIFRRDLRPTWDGAADSPPGPWEFYFYGITGRKLVTIRCAYEMEGWNTPNCRMKENIYFGSKMIKGNGTTITDRLGSVRADGSVSGCRIYPYGEDRATQQTAARSSAPTRGMARGVRVDCTPTNDYADQGTYDSIKAGSSSPGTHRGCQDSATEKPTSWNRYAYGIGDPINMATQLALTLP